MKDNDVEIVLKHKALEDSGFAQQRSIDFQMRGGPSIEEFQGISRKSQALQSVINQNEDLMARLKTAMFRISELENQVEEKDLINTKVTKERESLFEENMILKEKEIIFRERTEKSLQRGEDLREENAELLERLEKVERAFRRLFKYREKLRTQIPEFKSLRKKSRRLREVNIHLRTQVEELTTRLQRMHTEMSDAQSNLIADYETQLRALTQKASERDLFKKAKVEFENRSIELEREIANTKASYSKESLSLRTELDQYRKQNKELLVQGETLKAQVATQGLELSEITSESQRLNDQVESLQILWKEKQEELERAQEKNRSLQKLNQDISQKLNETKREVAVLKQKLEAETEVLNRVRQASYLK